MEPGDRGSANLNGSFKVLQGSQRLSEVVYISPRSWSSSYFSKVLEHWRVPDAEPYLKETFIFEFCFRVCGHTLIPH